MVIWCSWRSLVEASSDAASRWSVVGSPPRGAVPAMGWERTMSPATDTSSSGLAATKPADRDDVAARGRPPAAARALPAGRWAGRRRRRSGGPARPCRACRRPWPSWPARPGSHQSSGSRCASHREPAHRRRAARPRPRGPGGRRSGAASPIVVIQRVPSSARPATTAGTTRSLDAPGVKGSAPKATGPQPGSRTSSSTSIAGQDLGHRAGGRRRIATRAIGSRAAQPRPASPDRPRSNSTRLARRTPAGRRRRRAGGCARRQGGHDCPRGRG